MILKARFIRFVTADPPTPEFDPSAILDGNNQPILSGMNLPILDGTVISGSAILDGNNQPILSGSYSSILDGTDDGDGSSPFAVLDGDGLVVLDGDGLEVLGGG